jgi:alpha-N-arabinofuranosidase
LDLLKLHFAAHDRCASFQQCSVAGIVRRRSDNLELRLTMTGGTGSVGAANNGYYGIPLTNGATYNLSFYARASNGFSGSIAVALESARGGAAYAQTTHSGLTTNWQQFSASLVPNTTDPAA